MLRNPDGRLAVVRTPLGLFLPGGGQQGGEPPEQAALRELKEECGLLADLAGRIGVADEFVFSEAEATHFAKRSTFFRAREAGAVGSPEPDHALLWIYPDEAEARLAHGSHRWAVRSERLAREGGAAI